jgi:hypothetical protein
MKIKDANHERFQVEMGCLNRPKDRGDSGLFQSLPTRPCLGRAMGEGMEGVGRNKGVCTVVVDRWVQYNNHQESGILAVDGGGGGRNKSY